MVSGKRFALEEGGSHCANRYDMEKAHRQQEEKNWLGLLVLVLDIQLASSLGLSY